MFQVVHPDKMYLLVWLDNSRIFRNVEQRKINKIKLNNNNNNRIFSVKCHVVIISTQLAYSIVCAVYNVYYSYPDNVSYDNVTTSIKTCWQRRTLSVHFSTSSLFQFLLQKKIYFFFISNYVSRLFIEPG